MSSQLSAINRVSEHVACHLIEGELIIVPTVSGVGGDDGEFFRMNRTGHSIWCKLDGKRDLAAIIQELSEEFDAPKEVIQPEVLKFIGELLERKMISPDDSPEAIVPES
ncbi:MAG: PqqD family protein [Deltaproteobacteria bacterium]|nr:PqqD family protein [Deltaproteobacteria bacterium]